MSSDTAKENASVVESSVTEWKHDMENLDDPESPSYKPVEGRQSGAEERVHRSDRVGNSSANKKDKLYGTRYFIIKSLNHENIQLSIERGIWATQDMNEPILEEAFRNSGRVILIFSVNMSGFFQGYAQMMSSIGWRKDNVWSQGIGGRNQWGRSFKVKWLRLCDLPFQRTLHLKNPLNNNKPVKISRDCQELPQDIGEALCELIDGNIDVDVKLKRDDHPLERPFIGNPLAFRDEEYTVPPVHMTWSQTPMLYPALLYQHEAGPSNFPLERQRSSEVDQDNFSRWSAERSPLGSTLTEDDILEMAAGPSWRTQESTGKEHGDDLYSHCHSKKRSRHTHHK
ncbi:zinc finger CCCH domain-containing protein 45 isoform X2 [Cornus florida]|uniref:zinc finger CCCH domain-containing protein 45 isoform X2 n=1 Tax=Cornus florida TaxID=4283 RepID=UPI002897E192|nr:zinc finger CCCH domain-containing protein 45 isoform X2 [Cornus florida]